MKVRIKRIMVNIVTAMGCVVAMFVSSLLVAVATIGLTMNKVKKESV